MNGIFARSLLSLALLAMPQGGAWAASLPVPSVAVPPTDCETHIGYDRDFVMAGYLLPTRLGPQCVPFTSPAKRPPAGYKGDYYVDEFTDAKLRSLWEACEEDKDCEKRVTHQVRERHPPNKEYALTHPHEADDEACKKDKTCRKHDDDDDKKRGVSREHAIYLLGKIDEKGGDTDLKTIRRPAFFARAPYNEPIASDDKRATIVEFTAPSEPYERLHKHMMDDIKLRGWYFRGDGIDDGKGGKKRALIILSGGGGDRITAIDDPADHQYHVEKDGSYELNDYPNATTGSKGQLVWRRMDHALVQAGFDVLNFDRRGIGISGGYSDTNTLQQGRDLLKIIADLRSGDGMRALTPEGAVLKGGAAARSVHGGDPGAGQPVFVMGSSRGTMASGWAMTQNYDKDCSYDMPQIVCGPPVGDKTLRGAILISEFSSGMGYLPSQTTREEDRRGLGKDRAIFTGGTEVENNLVFFPSSAILSGIHNWPSAFFARGLWCYADALEGTVNSYLRVGGLKELDVVRGPHSYETWPEEEKQRITGRVIAYATAVVLNKPSIPGQHPWHDLKELVATAGDAWEASSQPTAVTSKGN